jgi:hypothetical protein
MKAWRTFDIEHADICQQRIQMTQRLEYSANTRDSGQTSRKLVKVIPVARRWCRQGTFTAGNHVGKNKTDDLTEGEGGDGKIVAPGLR